MASVGQMPGALGENLDEKYGFLGTMEPAKNSSKERTVIVYAEWFTNYAESLFRISSSSSVFTVMKLFRSIFYDVALSNLSS
jgi:hypothetical protein